MVVVVCVGHLNILSLNSYKESVFCTTTIICRQSSAEAVTKRGLRANVVGQKSLILCETASAPLLSLSRIRG